MLLSPYLVTTLDEHVEPATGRRSISLRVPEIDATGHVALRNRTLNVQIPKGVTEDPHIRLKGQGAPGIGRLPAGDFYLEVHFKTDPLCRVVGRDLYLEGNHRLYRSFS